MLQDILNSLNIKAQVVDTYKSGSITKYMLRLDPGAKINKLENCSTEIALALKAYSEPILKVETEKGLISLEMLTEEQKDVSFIDLKEDLFKSKFEIPAALGRTQDGQNLIVNIADMPHLLIAGTTGSGKSVMLHSIINSIIASGKNIRVILIDPKKVEFSYYKNIKQLIYPVIIETHDAVDILDELIEEMNDRFSMMAKSSVVNINSFNLKKINKLPYIVLIIDEFSDLMSSSKKEFQQQISTLAQKSRACGIHIIIATQRPSVDVITGLIKANFPARISCRLPSSVDSRTILGCNGAEKLLGKGDALIKSSSHDLVRFKGAFISSEDIIRICENNQPNYWSKFKNWAW